MTTTYDLQVAIINATDDKERAAAYRAAYNAGYRYAVTGCNLSSVALYRTAAEAVAHRKTEDGVDNDDKVWCGGSGDGIEIIEYEMAEETLTIADAMMDRVAGRDDGGHADQYEAAESAVREQIELLTADDVIMAACAHAKSGEYDSADDLAREVAYAAVSVAADLAADRVRAAHPRLAAAIMHYFA